uniref:Cobalamin biosynthesis protein CobD n=1 Tax=Thermosporothrix sp. COM3 TaxID=2490863 RepID=A0A455SBW0_9CHLR|nr:cobalamin biosynthesis protein CobD [Thermosporothrix sp. COM3]
MIHRWMIELAALLVAQGLDLLGEPPLSLHPVVWYGKLIRGLEKRAPGQPGAQLCYGVLMLVLAAPFALVPAWIVQRLAKRVRHRGAVGIVLYGLLIGAGLKPFFALRMLVDAGAEVRQALERDDIVAAREALRSLVSRDRSRLDAELAGAAAIESLAENLSDSVVAPLFYYACFGLPGAALYRLVNTFDSMIGYRGTYEYLGKAAARLDDLLNLVPSRLTASLIVLCAPLFGGDRRQAWRIWRRDARNTASPNAGHPMAAAAGALGVRLEKVGHYVLGEKQKELTPLHIQRAERMVWLVGGGGLLLALLWRQVCMRNR